MIYEYRWKDGARVSGLDAQKVGEKLQAIESKNGALTAKLVVREARKKTSPLHSGFEWDDQRAATEFRLEQARSIIRSVVVEKRDSKGEPRIVRAFVTVEAGEYEGIDVVLQSPEKRQVLLTQAWADLQAWRRRYDDLEELAAIYKAMDQSAA